MIDADRDGAEADAGDGAVTEAAPSGPLMTYVSPCLVLADEGGRIDFLAADGRTFHASPAPHPSRAVDGGELDGREVRLVRHYDAGLRPLVFSADWDGHGLVDVEGAREPLTAAEFRRVAMRVDGDGNFLCHLAEPVAVQAAKVRAAGEWERHGADLEALARRTGATLDPSRLAGPPADGWDWSDAFPDPAPAPAP